MQSQDALQEAFVLHYTMNNHVRFDVNRFAALTRGKGLAYQIINCHIQLVSRVHVR